MPVSHGFFGSVHRQRTPPGSSCFGNALTGNKEQGIVAALLLLARVTTLVPGRQWVLLLRQFRCWVEELCAMLKDHKKYAKLCVRHAAIPQVVIGRAARF